MIYVIVRKCCHGSGFGHGNCDRFHGASGYADGGRIIDRRVSVAQFVTKDREKALEVQNNWREYNAEIMTPEDALLEVECKSVLWLQKELNREEYLTCDTGT